MIMNEEEHHMFDKKAVARALCADIIAMLAALIIVQIIDIGLAIKLFVALTAIILWKIVYIVFVSADIDIGED